MWINKTIMAVDKPELQGWATVDFIKEATFLN